MTGLTRSGWMFKLSCCTAALTFCLLTSPFARAQDNSHDSDFSVAPSTGAATEVDPPNPQPQCCDVEPPPHEDPPPDCCDMPPPNVPSQTDPQD